MKLLVISDLHLGDKSRFDNCGWDFKEFKTVLETVQQRYKIEQTVLNGDIFELYKHKYTEIAKTNAEFISYLQTNNFVYIKGNHDWLLDGGVDSYQLVNSQGKKIHIEHGHNADFLNGTSFGRVLGKAFFKILKQLMSVELFLKIYFKIVEFDDEVNRVPKKYNSIKYLKYALKLLKHHDVVIMGHTHKMEIHKTYYLNNKKRYLNTGACSLSRFQGIILDTETLEYDTVKIDKEEFFNNDSSNRTNCFIYSTLKFEKTTA